MNSYILSLDQGTTSSRAIIFNTRGEQVASAQKEFRQYTPRESWVEHNAEEIWESQLEVAREALSRLEGGASSIAALGITNQRETTVLWDAQTGRPVAPAVVWQCRRSEEICNRLRHENHQNFIREKTGLVLDAYFSGTKIRWLLDQYPELADKARQGRLRFGTIDSWLLWKLTGGRVHATDISNASRTMLMNLKTGDWDSDMLGLLDIPPAILPEIRPSIGVFGYTDAEILGKSIPVSGMAGDQHAALFGHRAFSAGDIKNTYGTGCFMLMNTGRDPVPSPGGLLSTVAWGTEKETTYALEGSVFMAGALFQWLRDNLQLVESVQEIDRLAEAAGDNGGVYLVPAFQGLGTPWWSTLSRGTLTGLTRAAGKPQVCRAFIESVAYRSRDVIDVMIKDSGRALGRMRVDGGATNSNILMQFQADILGIPVERPSQVEMTALGAALMAGLGAGLWGTLDDLLAIPSDETIFSPAISAETREELYSRWLATIRKSLGA